MITASGAHFTDAFANLKAVYVAIRPYETGWN